MTYRDDMEAAQARIRTLSAELEAAQEGREAAEAARRAAEAARDELRRAAGAQARPRRGGGMALVAAASLVASGVLLAFYSSAREQHAKRLATMREERDRVQQTMAETFLRQKQALRDCEERAARARATTATPTPPAEDPGPLLTGPLDKTVIQRVIRSHLGEVKHCYEKQLVRKPDLGGRVNVDFTIGATGQVVAATVADSTLGDRAVAACITAAVKRWLFPAPKGGGIVKVRYPFVLRSAGMTEEPAADARSGEKGTLRINARPPATVTLDGKRLGVTPLLSKLPPGRHVLKLSAPGHKPLVRAIVVKAGEAQTVAVRLAPK